MAEAKKKVSEKLGGSGRGGGGSGSGGGSDVIELTEANFDKLVLQSDDVWLVEVRNLNEWILIGTIVNLSLQAIAFL